MISLKCWKLEYTCISEIEAIVDLTLLSHAIFLFQKQTCAFLKATEKIYTTVSVMSDEWMNTLQDMDCWNSPLSYNVPFNFWLKA